MKDHPMLLNAGAAILAAYVLWTLYLALQNVYRVKRAGQLTRLQLGLAAPLLIVGGALDVAFNLLVGTVLLADVPQEWTLSQRLSRLNDDPGWRGHVARVVGAVLLDPFDPTGRHLD